MFGMDELWQTHTHNHKHRNYLIIWIFKCICTKTLLEKPNLKLSTLVMVQIQSTNSYIL